ncbi:hypothetical protein N4R57_14745 [Rhodobacteraceae bacterium D3-12]|nr:hypothetical protein N4R57_14745 [Rhodobacteraceae bacterium D3-12]
MPRKLVFAVVLALTPASAFAAEWWEGFWSWDKSWCNRVDQIGEVTPAPIAILGGELRGYENTCRIADVRQLRGMQAVKLAVECQSEGSIYRESRLIMGEGDMIWMWSGQGEPLKFHRCRPPGNSVDWLNRK